MKQPIICIFILEILLMAVSCSNNKNDFNSIIEKIDNENNPSLKLYEKAIDFCDNTNNSLRLLKRAKKVSLDYASSISDLIMKKHEQSDQVELAILDIFLDTDQYTKALELFNQKLDPKKYPNEYAETFILSINNDISVNTSTDNLLFLTSYFNDSDFIIASAINAVNSGDKTIARALLHDSSIKSDAIPIMLAWDCAYYDYIIRNCENKNTYNDLALCADSYFMQNNNEKASEINKKIIELYPDLSYRNYAAFSRLVEEKPDNEKHWQHESLNEKNTSVGSKWWALNTMLEKFPDSDEAKVEYAYALVKEDKYLDAKEIIKDVQTEKAMVLNSLLFSDEKKVFNSLVLLSKFPQSGFVLDTSLEILAKAKRWDEFLEILNYSRQKSIESDKGFMWDVIAYTLGNDIIKAKDILENRVLYNEDFYSCFNLGIIEMANSREQAAIDAFSRAVSRTNDPKEKAEAYIYSGYAELNRNEKHAASQAFYAALSCDPSSRKAKDEIERLKE